MSLGKQEENVTTFVDFRKKVEDLWASDDPNDIREAVMKLKSKGKKFLRLLDDMRQAVKVLQRQRDDLKEDIKASEKRVAEYERVIQRHEAALKKKKTNVLFSEEEARAIENEIFNRHKRIEHKEALVEKKTMELDIKQNELQQAIEDTNLVLSSYYRLSDDERELFEKERGRILAGIEKHGSLASVFDHDKTLTSRLSQVVYLSKKHEEFARDLQLAKEVFKERLNGVVIDRAIHGTENPVFSKGQHVGDYKIRDNKLLVEAAKAQVPETYDRGSQTKNTPSVTGGGNINIISFKGADESTHGYARNVGVVKSVSDTGAVERITQEKKMIEFYKNKRGAEIVEAEVIDDTSD